MSVLPSQKEKKLEKIIIASNLIGIIALLFWTYSLQKNDKKQIIKLQLLANIFYAIQYAVIGAITAGMMNIVSIIRYSAFYKMEEKGKKLPLWLLFIFIIGIIVVGAVTYRTPLDFIPMGICIFYTYITWQKNTKVIRFGVGIAAIGWIYYNFSVQAYASVIGNLLEIASGVVAIYRFDIKKKKEKA